MENFSQMREEIDSLLDDGFIRDREEDWKYFCEKVEKLRIRDEREKQRQFQLEKDIKESIIKDNNEEFYGDFSIGFLNEENLDVISSYNNLEMIYPDNISKENIKLEFVNLIKTIEEELSSYFQIKREIFYNEIPIFFQYYFSESPYSEIESFLDFVFKDLSRFTIFSVEIRSNHYYSAFGMPF